MAIWMVRSRMAEVTGPVIAIVLVLCAAFIPVAFLGGLAGELYRQFSVTITIAVVLRIDFENRQLMHGGRV